MIENNRSYKPSDGFPYYHQLAGTAPLHTLFDPKATNEFINSIPPALHDFRYAPNKWSVKQVVGHIIDHERIKVYRAFELSRRLPVQLWGYDQNSLVENARFDVLDMEVLRKDYNAVRQATIHFMSSLSEAQMSLKGSARKYSVTLSDFLRSIIGHEIHHLQILSDKYL